MKQSEIDKAVNDWTDGFGGSTVEIAQLKKDVAAISFRAGAEMVNKAQPYSKEDIQLAMKFAYNKGIGINLPLLSPDELLKLWEETK